MNNEKICEYCHKTFYKEKRMNGNWNRQRFCNNSCSARFMHPPNQSRIDEMKRLLKEQYSISEIARRYDITKQAASAYIRKHVSESHSIRPYNRPIPNMLGSVTWEEYQAMCRRSVERNM